MRTTIFNIVSAILITAVIWFQLSTLAEAEQWRSCGANLDQGISLSLEVGKPNILTCFNVEVNTSHG